MSMKSGMNMNSNMSNKNSNKKYLGVDIGGTYIKMGVFDSNGKISIRREIPVDRSEGGEHVMETLMRSIDELSAEENIDISELSGIGVSAAGCINSKIGAVAENGGNVPGWSRTEVAGPLSERYGIGATLANDGNCVALAEDWTGAAAGCRNVLCVVIGTGVGGGIITDGKLVEGANGYAGEIGHFITHPEALPGGNGHYEEYASTAALIRKAKVVNPEWRSGRLFFKAAESGDPEALKVLDGWLSEIAYGLAGFVHTFDPELIVIGGGVSAQEELLVKPLRKKVLELIMPDFAEKLEFRPAVLGNDAGMTGAVRYFMKREQEKDASEEM